MNNINITKLEQLLSNNTPEAQKELSQLAPEIAQEIIRMREFIDGMIVAMNGKAESGEMQEPSVIAGFLKKIVLGE